MQEFLNLKTIAYILASIANGSIIVYLWIKIFNHKNYLKNIKYYIALFSLLVLSIINNEIVPQKFKIFIYSIICILILRIVFTKNIEKIINATIIAQLTSMVSEIIIVLCLSIIFSSDKIVEFLNTLKGFITINIGVSIVMFLLVKIRITNYLYNTLCKITNVIKKRRLIIYTILLIIAANILTYITYYNVHINIILIVNTILIIVYSIITYHTVKTDNKFQGISNKYNLSLDTLRENEKLLDDYKMYSHENKNTLKTIKHMVETNDKELLNYISNVIDDKSRYDEGIINETSIIPISGLKALIYSKIKEMKNHNIKNELYVDKSLKSADLIEIEDETLLDICKITGVFLDNAIEATKKLEDKQINISLYKEDTNIIIEIANTFSGDIDFENISKKGYTTKGDKHGYGLSLVDTILKNNKRLENIKQINNTIFIQTLKVKN